LERIGVMMERIGVMMEWRWYLEGENKKKKSRYVEMTRRGLRMALGKVRRRKLCCLPPISIVVLFS